MWSGGDDCNDQGETVRLYQPILYGRKPTQSDGNAAFVGGGDDALDNRPSCAVCQEPTHLLVQLCVPRERSGSVSGHSRTYRVFGCNHATCYNQLFQQDGPLSYSGGGVVFCQRISHVEQSSSESPMLKPQSTPEGSAWADEDPGKTVEDEDDWGAPE